MIRLLIIIIISLISFQCFANNLLIPKNGEILFDIIRKDKNIGFHHFKFRESNNQIIVEIDVDIQVKLGFLTIYKYRHSNTEIWKDNKIFQILTNSKTNSKKTYSVKGNKIDNYFEIIGIDGKIQTNSDIIPSSYWNYEIVNNNKFLDSQKGIIRNTVNTLIGEEVIKFNNRNIITDKYEILVTSKHNSDEKPLPRIFVWYGKNLELMKLQFDSPEDNSIIDYVRIK